jgi:sensor domain CHASE-containing protein
MSLRKKTILLISVTMFSLMGLLYGLARLIVLNSFAKLETQEVYQNVQRVLNTLSQELEKIDSTALVWSAWDVTYIFIEDGNAALTFQMDTTLQGVSISY